MWCIPEPRIHLSQIVQSEFVVNSMARNTCISVTKPQTIFEFSSLSRFTKHFPQSSSSSWIQWAWKSPSPVLLTVHMTSMPVFCSCWKICHLCKAPDEEEFSWWWSSLSFPGWCNRMTWEKPRWYKQADMQCISILDPWQWVCRAVFMHDNIVRTVWKHIFPGIKRKGPHHAHKPCVM